MRSAYTKDMFNGKPVDFERGNVVGIDLGERISVPIAEAIADYLNYLISILGVTQWRVMLYDSPPERESSVAMMASTTDTWNAQLWIADSFFDDSQAPDDWRTYVLIHEVLHLHFEQAWNYAEDTIARMIGEDAFEIWKRAYREFMELGIDGTAHCLAKLIPEKFVLPDEKAPTTMPKSRKKKK